MKPGILVFLFLMVMSQLACAQQPSKSEGVKKQTASMQMTEKEWQDKLSPLQYYVLREKGTEKPFSGEFVFTKDKGTYKCAGCGSALFTDEMKFESHCGWPSFDREMVLMNKNVQNENNILG